MKHRASSTHRTDAPDRHDGQTEVSVRLSRVRRTTSAPTEPRGGVWYGNGYGGMVWCGEDMFPSPVGKGMGSGNFGLCTSNPVNFDAFWVVFLTVQPLAIYAKTGAETDPGICARGLPSHIPSPPSPPFKSRPLKAATGFGGAL